MTDEKKRTDSGLPGDLSSIWQSALGQIDEIRDVIVRGSQAGKAKLDAQLLKRQRGQLLQQLGERVLEEHKRGAGPLPEGGDDLVKKLEEIDRQIAESEEEASRVMRK